MTLEVVRYDERGKLTSAGAALANPEGINQYSPQVRARRRIALAIDCRLAKNPECSQKVAEQVEAALLDLKGDGNLDIVKTFLPAEARLGVELSGPAGGPVEIASRKQWEGLSTAFSGRFAGDTELAVEQPDPSPVDGAD